MTVPGSAVPGSVCLSGISTVVVESVTLLRIRVSNPASNNVTLSLVTLACQFLTGITITIRDRKSLSPIIPDHKRGGH